MRSSEIVQVDTKSKDECPSKRHKEERRVERNRRPWDDEGETGMMSLQPKNA